MTEFRQKAGKYLQADMLQDLGALAAEIVTITPDSPRALSGERLASMLQAAGFRASAAASVHEALDRAQRLAGPEGVVLAAGSLYLAGAVRTELGLPWK